MPVAVFQKFDAFVQDIGRKNQNLHNDVLKVMLTNVAPLVTDAVKTDLTEISAGNGYVAGGSVATNNSYVQTAGVAKLVADDVSFTAVGGSIGPFRYAVLYDATAASQPLIGFWDYGSSQTLNVGDVLLVDFDQVAGILTVT